MPVSPDFALRDCVTIKEAAQLLGVTPETLRNWDRANKLAPIRHPVNGYRLYPIAELRSLLATALDRRGDRKLTKAGKR